MNMFEDFRLDLLACLRKRARRDPHNFHVFQTLTETSLLGFKALGQSLGMACPKSNISCLIGEPLTLFAQTQSCPFTTLQIFLRHAKLGQTKNILAWQKNYHYVQLSPTSAKMNICKKVTWKNKICPKSESRKKFLTKIEKMRLKFVNWSEISAKSPLIVVL